MGILSFDRAFANEEEKKEFVMQCETDFERRLDEVADKIMEISKTNKIFTLSGPTCSGKTTAAKKIVGALSADGKKVKTISLDDFFNDVRVPHDEAVKLGLKVDYDSISAMNMDYLGQCLESMCRGHGFMIPHFDFNETRCVGYESFSPDDYDFILIEGIQAVYPEISGILKPYGYCSVYISVQNDVFLYGERFSRSDIRFLRRLVRDCKFRSSSLDFTFYYWGTVRDNEKLNIIPNENKQDITIDSTMLYEIPMLKPFINELCCAVEPDGRYYDKVIDLMKKLQKLPEISSSYLPKNSIYREFLG